MGGRLTRNDENRDLGRILVSWYRRVRRNLPWRHATQPYRVWVAEVMLQQTTVRAVVPFYQRFIRRFPTLRTLARAPLPEVLAVWSGLGYYRRVRHLHATARILVSRRGGRFPRTLTGMLALPGVGRYTAGAVLSIAFGMRTPVLDGNVARVLSRFNLLRGDPREARNTRRLWSLADDLVVMSPAPGDLNQALMELGATLCTPTAPACTLCPIGRRCAARAAAVQDTIPPPRARRPPVHIRTRVALVARNGRFLMRRRRGVGLMEGLWEFPTLDEKSPPGGRRDGALRVARVRSIGTLRHTVTYRRIEVEIVRARLIAEVPGGAYRWVTPAQTRKLPTSSLVPKILAMQRR